MPKIYPEYWDKACSLLSLKDPILKKIINNYQGEKLYSHGQVFHSLGNAIVGQQISTNAAKTIWQRLLDLQNKGSFLKTKTILQAKDKDLRFTGLSKQKIEYLKNTAEYLERNKTTYKYYSKKSIEEIKNELIEIKGIGPWTIDMFLIFCILAPDLFPSKDLGLIKAIKRHYGKDKDLENFSQIIWRPYRTVATWYLWRSLDSDLVQY